MSSEQALRNAELGRALEELKNEVRREPANVKHRIYMFQLATIIGDWDRALTQLNVARDMDPACLSLAQTYQELIQCEVLRKQVFAGERSPLMFGEPAEWLALILQATKLTGQGKFAEGQRLRAQALEAAPAVPGTIKLFSAEANAPAGSDIPGERFAWLADADTRLGPLLEAVVNGRYYWVPLDRVGRIDFEKPVDLRDLVWLPAHFMWTNGGEAVGFVPSRYPGSESSDDDLIRLARKTEWHSVADDVYLGLGQRVLTTDAGEYSLFDVKQVSFDAASGG